MGGEGARFELDTTNEHNTEIEKTFVTPQWARLGAGSREAKSQAGLPFVLSTLSLQGGLRCPMNRADRGKNLGRGGARRRRPASPPNSSRA